MSVLLQDQLTNLEEKGEFSTSIRDFEVTAGPASPPGLEDGGCSLKHRKHQKNTKKKAEGGRVRGKEANSPVGQSRVTWPGSRCQGGREVSLKFLFIFTNWAV